MALNGMGKIYERLRHINRGSRCKTIYSQKCNFSFTQAVGVADNNMSKEPITYSKTPASKLTTEEVFNLKQKPGIRDVERYVIIASLAVFLVYFCILREENKIDEILKGTYDYEGDEELKLVNARIQAKLKGLKTDDIDMKLQELRKQK